MNTVKNKIFKHASPLAMLILGVCLLTGFWSCQHETDPPDGPNLVERFGPFEVLDSLSLDRTNVDFSAGENVAFSARFNKNIDWVITITGTESGAVKIIEGFDRNLTSANAIWNGTTTILPFFRNELCTVELTVPEAPDYIDSAEVEVIGTRIYNGLLVTDWEDGVNPGFSVFTQSGANMRFDTVVSPTSVQGSVFYELSGDVEFADDLGNISMPKGTFADGNETLSPNSDFVYFNVFARRGPSSVNDIFVIQFMEDDDGSGGYNGNGDDLHEFVFQDISSLNWEQFSIQYSNLTTTNSAGGGEKNPDRLIQMVILPIGLGEPFEGYLDYLIFTEGGPLQP